MSDKDFKVKNKLIVKGITSAGPITADSSGNIDSVSHIATQYGGTGTTTSPSSGQVLYSSSGTTYAPTTLSTIVTQQTPTDGASGTKTYVGSTTPSSPVTGDVWIDDTAGSLPSIFRWSKTAAGGETSVSGTDNSGLTLTYTAGAEQVYLNGTLLARGSDYVATNGSTITGLSPALVLNDIVNVISPLSAAISGTVSLTGDSTITGGLTSNTDSYFNGVRVGKGAGSQSSNMAIGNLALNSTTTGVGNVAIGNSALRLTTTGQANVAVGGGALELSVGGLVNTAVGAAALYKNTSGYNTAVGGYAMYNNTAGYFNVAVGASALNNNTTGYNNTGVGYVAMAANTIGGHNTALGSYALYSNTTGTNNTALGSYSMEVNTTGYENVAVGLYALRYNTFGASNVAVGVNTLSANTTGYNNVAVGAAALLSNTTGTWNVAIGTGALRTATVGTFNIAIGQEALYNATNSGNTVIGGAAGVHITTGFGNTIVGTQTASTGTNNLTTGSNNALLGYQATVSSATVSNTVTLGNSSISTLRCQTTSITGLSDARDKDQITSIPVGLDFINDLNPVTFEWKPRAEYDNEGNAISNANDGKKDWGFIAQDLLATEEKFNTREFSNIVFDDNPDRLEAAQARLIPILVKAVQELSAQLTSAKADIEILKGQINA